MKKLINATENFSKLDAINASNGKALQDVADGSILSVEKYGLMQDINETTGEIKDVAVLVTTDGEVYTSISSSVNDSVSSIIDAIIDGERISSVKVQKRVSKGGRDFLTLIALGN